MLVTVNPYQKMECNKCKSMLQFNDKVLMDHNEFYCRGCSINHLTHRINDYEDMIKELKE